MNDTITLPRSVVEQALEAFEIHARQYPHMVKGYTLDAEEALRAALDQPQGEQEPVAWIRRHPNGALSNELLIHVQVEQVRRESGAWVPLYTNPQNLNCKSTQARLATLWGYEKPQPNLQPLTDEEILKLGWAVTPYANQMEMLSIARAIERAHGIGGEE